MLLTRDGHWTLGYQLWYKSMIMQVSYLMQISF